MNTLIKKNKVIKTSLKHYEKKKKYQKNQRCEMVSDLAWNAQYTYLHSSKLNIPAFVS